MKLLHYSLTMVILICLEFSTSDADINKAAVLQTHNGYTDMGGIEKGLYSYKYRVLLKRRNMSYWKSQKVRLISMKLLYCRLTIVVLT